MQHHIAMPRLSYPHFVASCALLTLSATGVMAQDAPSGRYTDLASVVIADSAETKVADRRVRLQYPRDERQAGTEAEFLTVFVLDTTGRVEMQTVSFSRAASEPFRIEVCRWLAGVQLAPVIRDGVRRRAFVVNPFRFMLSSGSLAQEPAETGETLRKAIIREGLAQAASSFEKLAHC